MRETYINTDKQRTDSFTVVSSSSSSSSNNNCYQYLGLYLVYSNSLFSQTSHSVDVPDPRVEDTREVVQSTRSIDTNPSTAHAQEPTIQIQGYIISQSKREKIFDL